MKLFVVAHKKAKMPKDELYRPIQVGSGEQIYSLRDNIGDNIADKNPYYCELTAMYWIWKNIHNEDVVGISHYRRYLTKNIFTQKLLSKKDIERLLKDYDILVPRPLCMPNETVLEQFSEKHNPSDLIRCGEIIENVEPEYIDDFQAMLNSNYFYQYNMIIGTKNIYDSYMGWLFHILFELEKVTDIKPYDQYNQRLYGFLSERLLQVWLSHNKLRVKEMYCINTEQSDWTRPIRNIKNTIKESFIKR